MAVLALLEDIVNGCIRKERVFCNDYDFLAHDDDWLISLFRLPWAILLELCAELSMGLEREKESRITSTNPSPNDACFSGNRNIPEGFGWQVGDESNSFKPRHAGCFKG